MSQALYRKYRSKSLADIVGQEHITSLLSKALASGRIAHAYLLTGPKGVGKTSIARILAHEINQLPYTDETSHLDIIEIDAASNNGVEDVRALREKVQIAPVSAARKVYIIDEVHMLSKPAFNALLKTLEEPPEHVVFILATTDIDKLPATIISRTQRFAFRLIQTETAVAHLRHIADQEGIRVSDEALRIIAERGEGSFRDSISLLDQLAGLADDTDGITAQLVEASLGLAAAQTITNILEAVDNHDLAGVARALSASESEGVSPIVLASQLVQTLREHIAAKPQLLSLLDALLDVPRSTQPAIKLLTTLGAAATAHQPPKSVALATPVREVTASVEELSRQATQRHPRAVQQPAKKPEAKKQQEAPAAAPDAPFDWAELVAYTKEHFVALYSVLSKCGYSLEGSTLTLYAGNAFYKKKLDDPKYAPNLYESLKAIGSYQLTIHTLATAAPMKSSQAAAIADIMGGGIEVSPQAA